MTATVKRHWQDPGLRLWLRVVLYAADHADSDGLLILGPRQLHAALAANSSIEAKHISRAIHTAKKQGALGPGSSARRLRLSPAWGGTEEGEAGLW